MQFLYFRPNQSRTVKLDDVKAWGLGYAFDVEPFSAACTNNTPDGSYGQVFVSQAAGREVPRMDMDKQTWRKMPRERDGKPVYVGFWNESPPTPNELRRKEFLPGYQYELLDGNQWTIPLVRRYGADGHGCALPCVIDYDDEGEIIDGPVLQRYAYLWELTKPIVDDLLATYELGEPADELTAKQIVETAIRLLAANYRVGLAEVRALELLANDGTASGLAALACDWPELMARVGVDAEDQKKSDSADDAANTTNGDAA